MALNFHQSSRVKWVNTELCYAHSQAQFYVLQHMNYGYVLTTHGSGEKREIYAFYREAYTLIQQW